MENGANERLKIVRTHLHLKQKEMAALLNVQPSYYSEVERGLKKVTSRIAESLNSLKSISSDWLYTGKGSMIITNGEFLANSINSPIDFFVKKMEDQAKRNPNYAIAKNLAFKISGEHYRELKEMIATFNNLFDNTCLLMQFIKQYDFIITNPKPEITILNLLDQKSEKQIINEFKIMFSNLPKVLNIMGHLNASMSKHIEELRVYDIHNEFDATYLEDIKKLYSDFSKLQSEGKHQKANEKLNEALDLELIYNMLNKNYPQ